MNLLLTSWEVLKSLASFSPFYFPSENLCLKKSKHLVTSPAATTNLGTANSSGSAVRWRSRCECEGEALRPTQAPSPPRHIQRPQELLSKCPPLRLIKNHHEQPWLVWLSGLSASLQTNGLSVQFPVRAHAWFAGWVPSEGRTRGNHTLMFLSLSFSFPSLLSKNK